MKYLLYLGVCLLTLTCSCALHEQEPTPTPCTPAWLTLHFHGQDMTRTAEEAVHDVNLYLFHRNGVDAHHQYITTPMVSLELMPGSYDLYAVANAGHDLGELSISEVEMLESMPELSALGNGPLPMAARQRVDVMDGGTISIPLVRAVARLDFRYSVVGDFARQVTIRSVRLRNAARTMTLFERSQATLEAHVTDMPAVLDPGQEYTATWYLLENCQGEVPSITEQGQKEPSQAPALATYIQIEATAGGVEIIYRIYLGENNTSDFNIVRNRVYNLDVRIRGMNTVDTRVTTTELSVALLAQQYEQGETAYSELTLRSTNVPAEGRYTLRYTCEQGTGRLRVNGSLLAVGEDFTLYPYNGEVSVPLEYTQAEAGEVRLRLSVSAAEGAPMERLLETAFVKPSPHLSLALDKTQLYAQDRATVRLTVSQRGYTGKYDVTATGTALLFLNTSADLNPATSFSIPGPGTYNLRLRPEVLGKNPFTVTVRDAEGQTTSVTGSVQGLKRTATYRLRFDSSVEGELTVLAEGDYPVQENLYLVVKPTLQIRSAGGSTTNKSFSMPVLIQKGRDVAGYTLDLGLSAGQSYSLSTYTSSFSRTTSINGMVDYRVK